MEFSDAVPDPSISDKTKEEEEEREEEEDEDVENNVEQECTTSVPEDTAASGLSKQADKPNGTEHEGIEKHVVEMYRFDVLLTVRLGIISVTNQLNARILFL